jgi:hypothetical protein
MSAAQDRSKPARTAVQSTQVVWAGAAQDRSKPARTAVPVNKIVL